MNKENKKERIGVISFKEYVRRIELLELEIDKISCLMVQGSWIRAYEQISQLAAVISDMRTLCPRLIDKDKYSVLPHY